MTDAGTQVEHTATAGRQQRHQCIDQRRWDRPAALDTPPPYG